MKSPIFPPTLASLLLLAAAAPAARAEPPTSRPSLFDPARHMRLADVHPGMKGYGLTVFHGTQIEKFDVEVVDIVKNFGTGFSAILINCTGQRSEHFNSVEGMSGSPVYLMAPDGTPRLIGAYAFGWDFARDPLAGVQPIEYMLDLADPLVAREGSNVLEGSRAGGRARWTIGDLKIPAVSGEEGMKLMVSGVSGRAAAQLSPLFQRYGVRALFAGGGGASTEAAAAPASIEPGSSLVVPLVTGDTEMTALGTCTEVIGDRVYGFGHAFFGDGGCELPMAAGYVNTVVASLKSSFKMGGTTQVMGVLRADTQVGIGGTFSGRARTIPVSVRVAYDDGSVDRTYHFQVVRHPKLTPLLTSAAISAALNGVRDLPLQCTLDAEVNMAFPAPSGPADPKLGAQPGTRKLAIRNRLANPTAADLMMGVLAPLLATGDNPFARVYPDSVDATFTVHREVRSLELITATATRKSYHPGDTVNVDVSCRPFRSAVESRRIKIKLPKDIEPGDHPLVISDAGRFLSDEQQSRPDKFSADSLPDIFATLAEETSAPNNAIYARLSSDPSGVSVGRIALPKLPGSRAQLITEGDAPGVSPLVPSIVQTVKTEEVVTGEIELTITVEAEGKKHEPQPAKAKDQPPQHNPHGKLPAPPPNLGNLPGDEG